MVVETAARQRMTLGAADDDYTVNGIEHPVSGDLTAGTAAHEWHRHATRAPHTLRQGVAGGWLQRATPAAEGVTQVRCEDCPWGLDVQGWDERAEVAEKLAQRHAERRGHTIRTAEKSG